MNKEYYFDENYGCIKIPNKYLDRKEEISFDGKKLYIDKNKVDKIKLKKIYLRLNELEFLMGKNNTRYKHHSSWSEYNDNYTSEIKELEKQIEKIKG